MSREREGEHTAEQPAGVGEQHVGPHPALSVRPRLLRGETHRERSKHSDQVSQQPLLPITFMLEDQRSQICTRADWFESLSK